VYEGLLLRGLRFANSRTRPNLPHGTSCCGIFATLGEYFSPITLLGDFPVRMSQLEHVGGRAHGCRDDSIDCDSGVRCRFCAGPLGRQARPLRRCEIEEGTVSDFTSPGRRFPQPRRSGRSSSLGHDAPSQPALWQVPARRFDSGGSGRLRDPRLAWVRAGGRAALMRINIWIVLGVLLVLLAVTRLWRYQQDTQRICADDPSASVCGR